MKKRRHWPTFPAGTLPLFVGLCLLCVTQQPAAAGHFTIGQNFSDTSYAQSRSIVPDTMGAVGPSDVSVLINGRFSVYNRSGIPQMAKSLNQFWIDAGVTPSDSFAFAPRIIYDKFSGRWFATSVDNSWGANNFLVAVSNTGDPKDAWTGFSIDSDADDSHWADFTMMGLNQDVVTISANMVPIGAGSTNTGFLVIPKSDLTQVVPTIANATQFQDVSPSDTGFSAQPILDYDNGTLPLPILSAFNKPSGLLKTSDIGGTANAPTLNTAGGSIGVTSRSDPPDINQPGPKVDIDGGTVHFRSNAVMQQIPGRTNPSIWGVHGVDIGGWAALEWYEIDSVSGAVLQSGTISDPSLAFNYPSIAVNNFGDIVVGFSGGDPNTFMSTYAAVGQTAAGVTTFDRTVQTKAGLADYQRLDSSGRNRWGDYSATVVDPIDEHSFWTVQEFANATNSWQIQVTQITIVPEIIPGDMTGDGLVNLADVPAFVQALVDRPAYDAVYPLVNEESAGDIDGSGTFDLGDTGAFSVLFEGPASPPYFEDFEDGIANHIFEVEGNWQVTAGRFEGVSADSNSNALAVVEFANPLPGDLQIQTIVQGQDAGSGFFQNSLVVFDFLDSNNFKFAGPFYGSDA